MTANFEDDEDPTIEQLYNIAWFMAFVLVLMATILSVIFLLIINESGKGKETVHFLAILDDCTRGIGSHSPVIFLYFSLVAAVGGLIIWMVRSYSVTSASFITCLILLVFSGAGFICFLLHGVSALYACRHTQAKIQLLKPQSVPAKILKQHLVDLMSKRGGLENINSENDFINYIRFMDSTESKSATKRLLTHTTLQIARELFKEEIKKVVVTELKNW